LILVLIHKTVGKYPDIDFLDAIGLRRKGMPLTRIVVLPALLGLVFAGLSAFFLFSRSHQPVTPLGEMVGGTTSSLVFMAFLFVAVLMAPF